MVALIQVPHGCTWCSYFMLCGCISACCAPTSSTTCRLLPVIVTSFFYLNSNLVEQESCVLERFRVLDYSLSRTQPYCKTTWMQNLAQPIVWNGLWLRALVHVTKNINCVNLLMCNIYYCVDTSLVTLTMAPYWRGICLLPSNHSNIQTLTWWGWMMRGKSE